MNNPPLDYRKYLNYNPDTGSLTYKITTSRKAQAGKPVKKNRQPGYNGPRVSVMGRSNNLFRILWYLQTGEWTHNTRFKAVDGNWNNLKFNNIERNKSKENIPKEIPPKKNSSLDPYNWFPQKWEVSVNDEVIGHYRTLEECILRTTIDRVAKQFIGKYDVKSIRYLRRTLFKEEN